MKKFFLQHFILFNLFIFYSITELYAQQTVVMQHDLLIRYDSLLNHLDNEFHTGLKPYFVQPAMKINPDSVDAALRVKTHYINWFWRKLRYENLIGIDTQDFKLNINPVVIGTITRQTDTTAFFYQNTRGFRINGTIRERLAFESSFYENQSEFPSYISDFVKTNGIAPGQGLVKSFKSHGYDYAYASGLVSFSPGRYFNIQFGHGKNFIGDGYRSLLLSDVGFNYPFLKINTTVWKISYTNLFATFIDTRAPHTYEGGFQKKHATFHYLSVNLHKRLQIGLFEAIIWQDADSTGRRGYDLNYFNPVIFYRPVEFSLSSPDNALIGATMKLKISNALIFYGQLVIDDFDLGGMKKGHGYLLNKTGYQTGLKYYNFLGIPHLFIQAEYNRVRPYVYAHKSPSQNYTHYNQPLAHPLGANFEEITGRIDYRINDFIFRYKINYARYGADTNGTHWGHDIFISDFKALRGFPSYNNTVLQGLLTTLTWHQFEVAYLLNPRYNLCLNFKISMRTSENMLKNTHQNFITAGISTSLENLYYDF